MKALSIKQPFAGLIFAGIKRLEIRTWETSYRGPLLICASRKPHPLFMSYDYGTSVLELDNRSAPDRIKVSHGYIDVIGSALCVVNLVGIRPFMKGEMQEKDACIDWIPNAFAWELESPRPVLRPLPVLGKLKIFDVDDSLILY